MIDACTKSVHYTLEYPTLLTFRPSRRAVINLFNSRVLGGNLLAFQMRFDHHRGRHHSAVSTLALIYGDNRRRTFLLKAANLFFLVEALM